jgi:pimeloyl-ACP methyl ester carboxylesterase
MQPFQFVLRASLAGAVALAALGAAHATPAEMRPILKKLLRDFQGCIVEKYETSATAGLQKRDGSHCMTGPCTLAQRERGFAKLTRQANAGDDREFSSQMQRILLRDCMNCGKHRKWHTKHVHCTMDCGGNHSRADPAGWGIGPCFEGCKAGVDITKFFNDIVNTIKQALGAAPKPEAADHLGGKTIATNYRTVERPPSENCALAVLSRDYFTAPSQMLDWTANRTPTFKLTLIESLKALAVGAGVLAGGLAGFLGPFVATGVTGGVAAIAMSGIPSSLLSLPEPVATTNRRKHNRPEGSNIGANEGRLVPELRAVARAADPLAALCKSAEAFAQKKAAFGRAYADLAVTGRRAYRAFRRLAPKDATIVSCLKTKGSASVRKLPAAALSAAAKSALDRAYSVAHVIRAGGFPGPCRERKQLGWIAVSGEDDQPHRPVNVPSAPYPQYDFAVRVGRHTVNTRFMIAHSDGSHAAPGCKGALASTRKLPPDPKPKLARNAEVLLYVLGMGSRVEEALDLAAALAKIYKTARPKKNWTILSVDLPTAGYADNLDHTRIAPLSRLGEPKFRFHGKGDLELTDLQVFNARGRHDVPLVQFMEDFVVSFVEQLDRRDLRGLTRQFRAAIGGSLGGNLSLRLGRRAGARWLKAVVPWSPAAIWPSYADGGDPTKHLAVAMPFLWAGGDPRVQEETPARRREYFYKAFDWAVPALKIKAQGEEWYRPGWSCKEGHLKGARLDRHETYDRNYRLWHWRLGAEQLLVSHQGVEGRNPPYLNNTRRTLLMCGYQDTGGALCEHTRAVARKMVKTPGKAIFLKQTGHSIHNERPCWLAQHIVEFLGGAIGACY